MINLSRVLFFAFLFEIIGVFPVNFLFAAEKIDINTASAAKLQEIKWIGPVLAQKIIENRPFYSLDDLLKIKNIGEKKLRDIKEQGLAWVAPLPKPEQSEKTEFREIKKTSDFQVSKQESKSLFVFITALIIAIFSAIAILILKNKLKKDYNKKI